VSPPKMCACFSFAAYSSSILSFHVPLYFSILRKSSNFFFPSLRSVSFPFPILHVFFSPPYEATFSSLPQTSPHLRRVTERLPTFLVMSPQDEFHCKLGIPLGVFPWQQHMYHVSRLFCILRVYQGGSLGDVLLPNAFPPTIIHKRRLLRSFLALFLYLG